MIMVN